MSHSVVSEYAPAAVEAMFQGLTLATEEVAGEPKCSVPELQTNAFKADNDQVENLYDEWAATYEQDSLGKLGFASPGMCAYEVTKVLQRQGQTVVDVGCGTGLLADLLIQRGYSATFIGTDLSNSMLDIAAKKNTYKELVQSNVAEYPWPVDSSSADICMCNGVLIYVEDPECLNEFIRVTKIGGYCVLMFRHDGYPIYAEKDMQLRESGKWELVSKTEDTKNFQKATEDDPSSQIVFNIWTYKVLKH